MNLPMKLLIFSIFGLVASIVLAVEAQSTTSNDGPCHDAAVWHLHEALLFSESQNQGFHVAAAHAAIELGALGDNCANWNQDARPPGPNGDSSTESLNAMQSGG